MAPSAHPGTTPGHWHRHTALMAPTSAITPEPGDSSEGNMTSRGRGGGEENLAGGGEGGLVEYAVFKPPED